MKERTQIGIKLIATHILPLFVLVFISLFMIRDAFLWVGITQVSLLIVYFSGYWEFFSRTAKAIVLLVVQGILCYSLYLRIQAEMLELPSIQWIISLGILLIWMTFLLLKIILVIVKKESGAIEISFPFREGSYRITDGGNSRVSRLMNYHFYSPVHRKKGTHRSMLFATDIVKVNPTSAFLSIPRTNEECPVYGEEVFCPMDGIISRVVDDIPDNLAFAGNYPYNTGNTVIVRNSDLHFLLGHLKQGSLVVKEGDAVKAGDLLAKAGNSGMSERPHLHMQLVAAQNGDFWKGMGRPIVFRGKNLYKNRVIHT